MKLAFIFSQAGFSQAGLPIILSPTEDGNLMERFQRLRHRENLIRPSNCRNPLSKRRFWQSSHQPDNGLKEFIPRVFMNVFLPGCARPPPPPFLKLLRS